MDHSKQTVSTLKLAYLSLLPRRGEPAGSGVPKVSETLLREFEGRDDIQVSAVTMVDGLKSAFSQTEGSVTYHYLACPSKGKTATFYFREVLLLKKFLRQQAPDIVHGQPTSEYMLAASGCNIPHVLTVHGLVLREAQGLGLLHPGFIANVIREHLQRRAVRRSTDIISISSYVEDYLSGWCNAKIHRIPNPIDPEFFELVPPSGTTLKILCVGLVSVRKNQKLLVDACRMLKERGVVFECRIVGKIAHDLRQEMESNIRSYQLDGVIKIEGLVSREDLLASYNWSNVVVLPSREETSPLSLIQAMAGGRPVMGARSAGIPVLLGEGKHGRLFSPDSAQSLAEALEEFSTNIPAEFEKAREISLWAKKLFHPAAVADATVSAYKNILLRLPIK